MAKEDAPKITDIEIAKAVIAYEAVACWCGREQKATCDPKTLTSCTGGTFWGKPGEQWPVSGDGRPLIPWLQVVCSEAKGVHGPFYNRQSVCFFLRDDIDGPFADSAKDSGDFVVREYGLDDKLVPLLRPKGLKGHPCHQVIWEKLMDYPPLSKYAALFDPATYKALCGLKEFEFDNRAGTKIGGWPTHIQGPYRYPGKFDLQIDVTHNFMFGDSGIGYLSGRDARWRLMFESC